MMTPKFIVAVTIAGFVAIFLGCVTAAVFVLGLDGWRLIEEPTPVAAQAATPRPTFTITATPVPATETALPPPTATPTSLPPETATLQPTETPLAAETPTPPSTATPVPQEAAAPAVADAPPAESQPAGVDFVVAQQRMRSNAENSWEEVIANGCGSDHTIYVTVVDAAGKPLDGILVGDTYDNVRAVSGAAGVGKLEIELWSNTMALEVKEDVGSGETFRSEQTIPLSAKDEEIPTEWLLAGGYCPSMAECELRQNTNGLCRGHYSYDITFQRTW